VTASAGDQERSHGGGDNCVGRRGKELVVLGQETE
jgi:hypothetical protein